MIDINLIRSNPEVLDQALARRGEKPRADIILTLDNKKRSVINEMQILQQRRNDLSQKIGSIFKSKDDKRDQGRLKSEVERLKNEVGELKNKIASLKDQAEALEGEFIEIMSIIPNIPLPDVPEGRDEADNVEIKRTGHKRELNFTPRQHFEIGEALGLMDFSQTAKISGARFVTLNGALARLSRALGQYMLDTHTEKHGYTEVTPPLLVRRDAMFGTGQLPKFQDDQFVTGDGLWLIPTAEVVLTNLWRESIIDVEQLPLRVTALTNCFRREAGAAGRDTRGMIRLHQFDKVELVSATSPQDSDCELERMLGCAEAILTGLGLHYRVVVLSTGDMGFSASKTYDIEVWLPGQNEFREISSCSVCGDFQARRMMARYRGDDDKINFIHTLNGSGIAVGRALAAVMENYQQANGAITIPEVLLPYMGGMEVITNSD